MARNRAVTGYIPFQRLVKGVYDRPSINRVGLAIGGGGIGLIIQATEAINEFDAISEYCRNL